MKKLGYKRELKGMQHILRLMHAVDPIGTSAVMKKLAAEMQKLPLAPQPGAPLQWTPEWRAALVIFVERRVYAETYARLLKDGPPGPGKREIDSIRTEALMESTRRQFPFRERNIGIARQQLNESKRRLKNVKEPGEGLNWIRTALDLEATYRLFSHLGQSYSTKIIEIRPDYRAMPEWIWGKLAQDGRLLMPDVPKIN